MDWGPGGSREKLELKNQIKGRRELEYLLQDIGQAKDLLHSTLLDWLTCIHLFLFHKNYWFYLKYLKSSRKFRFISLYCNMKLELRSIIK